MKRALSFLSLLGGDGNLSLTNIAVYVSLVKIATTPGLSVTDVAPLLLSLLAYAHKRQLNSQAPVASLVEVPDFSELTDKLKQMESKVNGLAIRAGLK